MDSKLTFLLFLFITCSPSVFVHGTANLAAENLLKGHGSLNTQAASTPGGGSDTAPCIQMLMPCQPYLHSHSPPATCCLPLKEMISKDSDCLCKVFNNPALLRSMNLTQSQALELPKACGAHADISICKKAATPTSPPATPSPPTGSSDKNSTSSSKSAGERMVAAGTSLVSFLGLIVSAFVVYVV